MGSPPTSTGEEPAPEEVRWCRDRVGDVSRTFAISIDMMETPESDYIAIGYLLCRIADTIEDAPELDPETKGHLLREYASAFGVEDEDEIESFVETTEREMPEDPINPDHWRLVVEAPKVFRAYESLPADVREGIKPAVLELTYGMHNYCLRDRDRTGLRLRTLDDLERYCYFVASTVGHLLNGVFSQVSPMTVDEGVRERAETYGLLLQLCNISKDVHSDYHEEGSIYVPADHLSDRGVEQGKLLAPENHERTAEAVEIVIERAREHVEDARRYVTEDIDDDLFEAWALPYLLAIATLREVESNAATVLEEGGVKIHREEVYSVIEAVERIDPAELPELEARIEAGQFDIEEW